MLTEYSPDATGRYGLLTCNDNSSTYFAGVNIVGISNIYNNGKLDGKWIRETAKLSDSSLFDQFGMKSKEDLWR